MLFIRLLNNYFKAQSFNNEERHLVCNTCHNHKMLKSWLMPELNDDMTLGAGNNSNDPKTIPVCPREPTPDETLQ